MRWFPLLSLLVLGTGRPAPAQDFAPPPSIPPTAEQKKDLSARTEKLGNALGVLSRQGVRDPALADIEIFHKAADWIVRHNEFYQKEAVDVLYAWAQAPRAIATPKNLVPSEPVTAPMRPAPDASLAEIVELMRRNSR